MGADGALAGSMTAEHGHLVDLVGVAHRQPLHVHDHRARPATDRWPSPSAGTIEGNTLKGSISSPQFNGDLTGTRATSPTSSNPENESGFSIGLDDDDHSGREVHGHSHGRGGRQ